MARWPAMARDCAVNQPATGDLLDMFNFDDAGYH
jgi:hypothetical protein